MLKVGELSEYLAKREESAVTAKLEEFTVNDDATELYVKMGFEDTRAFSLDETATKALGSFLKVPSAYLNKITPDFKATLLRYELDRNKAVSTVVEALGGKVISLHEPSQAMLPLGRVGEVVTKVMKPEDTIRRAILNDTRFHLDVTTNDHTVAFNTYPEEPPKGEWGVGDITQGGLRILAHPFSTKRPSVGTYLERLVCTNGMCSEERLGHIELKGRTVDEVLVEMELAAQNLLGTLDKVIEDYSATRDMAVPGTPQAFAQQLAREANLSRKVLDKVLDIINQLPEPVSVWDVNQAFTSVAAEVDTYAVMTKLQTLGGHLAMNAPKMVERCKTCEQTIKHGAVG